LSQAVAELGLSFVVLTSVTRDDIADGGAGHFSLAVRALQERNPGVMVEVLIPDFSGSTEALARVLEARPAVLNHNVETVPRLYAGIRPRADYQQSLKVLERAAQYSPRPVIKSGLMLGLGENTEEIVRVMEDLLARGCDVLTLGQYLQPRPDKAPVARFVFPEEFNSLREEGLSMGFAEVVAGPYVRSSFQARNAFLAARRRSVRKGNARPLGGPPRPSRR
jgi:lipoic acid synthetase